MEVDEKKDEDDFEEDWDSFEEDDEDRFEEEDEDEFDEYW